MSQNNSITRAALLNFLSKKGWTPKKTSSTFTRYEAPNNLGFDLPFEIVLPSNESRSNINSVLNTLREIYNLSPDELIREVSGQEAINKQAIFELRLVGEDIGHGSIGLRPFEKFFDKLRMLLANAASFEITQSPMISRSPIETVSFLDSCRFLAPKAGSFILDIAIPTSTVVREKTFFDEEITADSIAERLFEIIEFTNSRILLGDQYVTNAAILSERTEIISYEVFKDLYDLLGISKLDELSFSYQKGNVIRRSNTGFLSDDKMRNLQRFVDFLHQNISDENEINVSGRILELHSRDPLSDRNRITVKAHNELGDLIDVSLNSALYQDALHAHSHKRFVGIKGLCRKMKTKIKITELHEFKIL